MKRISQTILKEYTQYLNGDSCGEVFRRRHITKDYPDVPTDAMQMGNFFEYLATDYYDQGRGVPEPKILKSGKMAEGYIRAENQAEKFKEYMKELDMEIVTAGEKITMELEDVTLSGLLDIRAKSIGPGSAAIDVSEGEEIIIDLKYSGLLGNKWEEGGYHPDSFQYRTSHHIQPAQYMVMTGLRFFFFVFGVSPAMNAEIFEVAMSDEALEFHKGRVLNISKKLEVEQKLGGFRHRPNFQRCRACLLFETCEKAAKIPDYHKIEVTPEFNTHLDQ